MRSLRALSILVAGLAAWTVVSIGCTTRPEPAARVIRVGYSGEADFSDLPTLIAGTRLAEKGYHVEPTFFSAADVAVQAASDGSVDIMHGSMISAWTAIGRGAVGRDDRVVALLEFGDADVAADLDVAEELKALARRRLLVHTDHRLDLRVIGGDAGTDEAERCRQAIEHVDDNGNVLTLEQMLGGVEARRS